MNSVLYHLSLVDTLLHTVVKMAAKGSLYYDRRVLGLESQAVYT